MKPAAESQPKETEPPGGWQWTPMGSVKPSDPSERPHLTAPGVRGSFTGVHRRFPGRVSRRPSSHTPQRKDRSDVSNPSGKDQVIEMIDLGMM